MLQNSKSYIKTDNRDSWERTRLIIAKSES